MRETEKANHHRRIQQQNPERTPKIGFQQVQLEEEYRMLHLPPYKLALRQPLYNGENFIDYLDQFVSIYQNIFIKMDDLPEVYVRFTREVIDVEDRTEFVREFYQVVLISYVSRFGTERLIEAALQIFRYTYVLRLQNNSIREKVYRSSFRKIILLSMRF